MMLTPIPLIEHLRHGGRRGFPLQIHPLGWVDGMRSVTIAEDASRAISAFGGGYSRILLRYPLSTQLSPSEAIAGRTFWKQSTQEDVLFRAPRKPLSLPRLCSRENVQHVFGSDLGVIAMKIGILVASDVSNEVGADTVTKAFEDGLQSAHLPLSSAPS